VRQRLDAPERGTDAGLALCGETRGRDQPEYRQAREDEEQRNHRLRPP
jgi:hypothetical protein